MILDYQGFLLKIEWRCGQLEWAQTRMSINDLLFRRIQVRKDQAAMIAAVTAIEAKLRSRDSKKAGGELQDLPSSIPDHPFDVRPWPEDARPKTDMPV